jgi:hypothetical protein
MLRPANNSRLLPALFALLLLGVALIASGCGDKKSSSTVPPQERVESALKNAANIKSGKSTLNATIAAGSLPGSFKVTGGGPFDTEAEGGAAFDISLKVNIAGFDQTIGLIAVDGKNYIEIGDKAFLSDKNSKSSGAIEPKTIQNLINSLNKYVSNVKQSASKEINGETVDVYSMTIDLGALAKDSVAKNDGAGASIPGLGNVSDLATSLGKADATVAINSDDMPVEIGIDADVGGATDSGNSGGLKGTLVLSDINEPVTIDKPKNVVTDSSALQALGGMLGGLGGGQ